MERGKKDGRHGCIEKNPWHEDDSEHANTS